VVIELAGEGKDQVTSWVSFALPADVENLSLQGSATQGLGNALANYLNGSEVDNWLIGGAGNDSLIGNDGNDSLVGGDGDDYLSGGYGDDILRGGAGTNQLSGGPGNDTYYVETPGGMLIEAMNEGIDTIVTSNSITMTTAFENVTFTGTAPLEVFGNDSSNILIGNSGDNVLYGQGRLTSSLGATATTSSRGGPGDDVIDGGNGSNWYVFLRGDGQDTLKLAAADSTPGRVNTLNVVNIEPHEASLSRSGTTSTFTSARTWSWRKASSSTTTRPIHATRFRRSASTARRGTWPRSSR
jgi:Ca2+-binding RTX toxin-like protein